MVRNRGAMFAGVGIGVGLMYFLDPERGRRRRALVRDQIAHSANISADAMGATGRDLTHRATGVAARVRSRLHRRAVDDVVLLERVRAQLGRFVSHPHAIDVEIAAGRVTLRGPILQAEVNQLLNAIERVAGVREVVSALEEHQQADNVPALQGGRAPAVPQPDLWQRQWAPTTRLLVGTAGAGLTGYGSLRRGVSGALLAVAGLGLIARAATNLETARLTGIGARRRAVDVQKTIKSSSKRDAPREMRHNP